MLRNVACYELFFSRGMEGTKCKEVSTLYADIDKCVNYQRVWRVQISNSRHASLVILVSVAAIVVPRDATAYVDPNSAGILYQIFFSVIVAVALAWRWIK